MARTKLTAAFCRDVACPYGKGKENYWDTEVNGFVLEVRASGGKTYYLRYMMDGKQRQKKLGGARDISFDQAKKAAKALRAEVTLGVDVVAEKKKQAAVPIYSDLAAQHIEHARNHLKSHADVERTLRNHVIPRWGEHRLDAIRPKEVTAWLAEKRNSGLAPSTCEKVRMMFGRSFELGQQWDIPGAETNPIRRVPRLRFDNARSRFLTAEEANRLCEAAYVSENRMLGPIVELLLHTGARKNELLHARWENVDLERQLWTIPVTKTGKARTVPLSDRATQVIEGLPRFDGCAYVLPNPSTRQPYTCLKGTWQRTRKRAGLPNLRIHDLRHSAASFMVNAGVDLFAVGRVLGHVDHQSTMRYAHLADDTLRKAVEAGAAGMLIGGAE